jgi:hypothetical protein
LVIDAELKCPSAAGDKSETFDKVLIGLEDIIRRTDGPFAIVSRYAVFKSNDMFVCHQVRSFTPLIA